MLIDIRLQNSIGSYIYKKDGYKLTYKLLHTP